ncbi:head completion/stabilization protein [Alcaligenaceae bacterium SJ-26]|nr:head completion/stabilization protein [Alcaligenaceae bacterium SJ-26]
MSFAVASAAPQLSSSIDPVEDDKTISREGWPDINLLAAREVLRLNGTVTTERLHESLCNAALAVNRELSVWRAAQSALDEDQRLLYLRAVYWYAKAELLERYRDYDLTGAGEKRAELQADSIDDCRRIWRWAISDIQGRPRLTVELL